MNYYELLEVSPNASTAVIRAAYKSLMQRYHPDKNAGNAEAAERASLVVQAYDVLSDAEKRAAYDRELRSRSERQALRREQPGQGANRHRAARPGHPENHRSWLLGLIIVAIVMTAWATLSLLRPGRSPARELAPPARLPAPEVRNSVESSWIPALVTGLEVNLNDADRAEGRPAHILIVPTISVRVGSRDAESAIRHLNNTAAAIRQKLEEDLAGAKFDELIKVDGERYLQAKILAAITQPTTPSADNEQAPPTQVPSDRYGAVEVALPQSYSVR